MLVEVVTSNVTALVIPLPTDVSSIYAGVVVCAVGPTDPDA